MSARISGLFLYWYWNYVKFVDIFISGTYLNCRKLFPYSFLDNLHGGEDFSTSNEVEEKSQGFDNDLLLPSPLSEK